MTFLKALWSDLVEKKLWPVAVVLVLALVAVPVLLGGSDDAADPASGAVATAPVEAGLDASVALDPAVPVRRDRSGKVRDPFVQQNVPKTDTALAPTTVIAPTAPSTPPAAAPTGSSGGSAPAGPIGPSATPRPSTAAPAVGRPNPLHAFKVSLRFGKAGKLMRRSDVARLSPLPSSTNPFFVYLGVLEDHKTAVFLISADVKATGDGTCRPRKSSCETIEMTAGETEFFDVVGEDGTSTTQYQLDVTKVSRTTSKSVVAAARARGTTSRAGQKLLRATATGPLGEAGSDGYSFSRQTGTLRRIRSAGLGAHLPAWRDSARAVRSSAPVAMPRFNATP